jgi:LuxR family maltose regulon positive regulatory protein
MSNREICEALFITVGTVKWYTNHIYRKLGVKNRGQAVAKARELQLFSD